MYVLHNLHGHLTGFHSFILLLNNFSEQDSFISFGIIAHIFGPKCAKVSVPYLTVRTFRVIKGLSEQYFTELLSGNTSNINWGDILFITLYNSIARVWMFLSWIVKELSLFRSSLNVNWLSSYTIRRDLSWILSIRLFSFLLWNIQTSGQYPNCECTKDFIIILRCFMFIKWDILDNACSFWLALRHKSDTWSSKDNVLSIIIPNNFSQFPSWSASTLKQQIWLPVYCKQCVHVLIV